MKKLIPVIGGILFVALAPMLFALIWCEQRELLIKLISTDVALMLSFYTVEKVFYNGGEE